jgi:lysophospholipase L1-like esterase
MSNDSVRLSVGAKWALLIFVSLVVCAMLLVAAETVVRMRAAMKHGTTATADELYTLDQRTELRVPIANLDTGRIQVNSMGFRGPELIVPKPLGTIRVAFLGASTTWCAEVSSNHHVWSHLVTEDLRRAWAGIDIDYVNGGVPGYTIRSSRKNLDLRIAPLQPDIIVIYHAANDLSAELRGLAVRQGVLAEAKFKSLSWPSNYSLLWKLAEINMRVLFAQHAAARDVDRLALDVEKLGDPFRESLTDLVVAAKGEAPLVILATFATQLRQGQDDEQLKAASQSAMYYMPFMTPSHLIRAYDRYNDIIRDVAADADVVLVDDIEAIPGTAEYFTDSVHFTDAGSRAQAERISRVLKSLGPPSRRPVPATPAN